MPPVITSPQSHNPMSMFNVPISVLTDSYKATHYLQYPGATQMVAVSYVLTTTPWI